MQFPGIPEARESAIGRNGPHFRTPVRIAGQRGRVQPLAIRTAFIPRRRAHPVVVPMGAKREVPRAQAVIEVHLDTNHIHLFLLDFPILRPEPGLEPRLLHLLPIRGEGHPSQPANPGVDMQGRQGTALGAERPLRPFRTAIGRQIIEAIAPPNLGARAVLQVEDHMPLQAAEPEFLDHV